MTIKNGAERAGLQFLALATFCLILGGNVVYVLAEVEPPSAIIFDNFGEDAESLILFNRLKQVIERKQEVIEQERELAEEQIALQAMLEVNARQQQQQQQQQPPNFQQYPTELTDEDPETLPVPSAVVHPHINSHSDKRTSYLSLCHFKICNIGRKRQM